MFKFIIKENEVSFFFIYRIWGDKVVFWIYSIGEGNGVSYGGFYDKILDFNYNKLLFFFFWDLVRYLLVNMF